WACMDSRVTDGLEQTDANVLAARLAWPAAESSPSPPCEGEGLRGSRLSSWNRTGRYAGRCDRRSLAEMRCARGGGRPKRASARESLGKEERCSKQLKTFRWNPVGQSAHPVESGQQPEASLASWQATVRAKRRQRVIRAGPFSPEIRSLRGSPCRARMW